MSMECGSDLLDQSDSRQQHGEAEPKTEEANPLVTPITEVPGQALYSGVLVEHQEDSNMVSVEPDASRSTCDKINMNEMEIIKDDNNEDEAETERLCTMNYQQCTISEEQSPAAAETEDISFSIQHPDNLPKDTNPIECANNYYFWNYKIACEETPKCLIRTSNEEFGNIQGDHKRKARYMKGCKWAPDGSCLLSNADDDNLRIFNFPSSFSKVQDWKDDQLELEKDEWCSVLKVKEGGQVYDFCWYPLMSSMDPVSSCFITSSSQAPVHLWDAFTGKLRASYQPFDHLEQLVSPYSITFDSTGERIYCGFEKVVRIFDITRPGRDCTVRSLKHTLPELNQYGIIASIAMNPSVPSMYAIGTFDKTIGLYCEDGSVICLLQGHFGGITHMKFSHDGLKLFTGGRKDSRLICWDLRKMGEEFMIFDRVVATHQRIYFDITPNDGYLVSGGTDGNVRVWEMSVPDREPYVFPGNSDCVNGISINPFVPLLATSSGQRHFFEVADDSDDDDMFVKSVSSRGRSCDIKLWKLT